MGRNTQPLVKTSSVAVVLFSFLERLVEQQSSNKDIRITRKSILHIETLDLNESHATPVRWLSTVSNNRKGNTFYSYEHTHTYTHTYCTYLQMESKQIIKLRSTNSKRYDMPCYTRYIHPLSDSQSEEKTDTFLKQEILASDLKMLNQAVRS